MPDSVKRVMQAFAHAAPDRTPLFEIFQRYQPIHWDICGRNPATDEAMAWDAMADGIDPQELAELHADAAFEINRFFALTSSQVLSRHIRCDSVKPTGQGHAVFQLSYMLPDLKETLLSQILTYLPVVTEPSHKQIESPVVHIHKFRCSCMLSGF